MSSMMNQRLEVDVVQQLYLVLLEQMQPGSLVQVRQVCQYVLKLVVKFLGQVGLTADWWYLPVYFYFGLYRGIYDTIKFT